MLLDEGFQHRNQVVVADEGLAIGIHIGCLDFAVVVQNQLIGKAMTLGIRGAVLIRVNHILEVVDHGLGQHHRLLALRQVDGLGEEAAVAIHAFHIADKAVEIHQHIVGGIQLIEDSGELLHRDEILIVGAGQFPGNILVAGSGGIRHENMERKVGNGGHVLDLNQLILLVDQFTLFRIHLLAEGAGVAVQQLNGLVVIIADCQGLHLGHQSLVFQLRLIGGTGLLLGLYLGRRIPVLLHGKGSGDGAHNKAENQEQSCPRDNGREIDLLENTLLLPLLPADIPGIQRIHGLLAFQLGHRLHIHIQELGEHALFRRIPGLLPGGLFLFDFSGQAGKLEARLLVRGRGFLLGRFLLVRPLLGRLLLVRLLFALVFRRLLPVDLHIVILVVILLGGLIGVLLVILGNIPIGICVQVHVLKSCGGLVELVALGLLLIRRGHVVFGDLCKIKIFVIRQKILRIEAVFFFKIEIDVEFVFIHRSSLPLW